MTPQQIVDRIQFLSRTAWDGWRVRMHKGRKLLLQGTHDAIYDDASVFALFTKITGNLPFDEHDAADYTRHDIGIDIVKTEPDLELLLYYDRSFDLGSVVPITCGRVYYACVSPEPETLTEIVDACYALRDEYDYPYYFKVPGPLAEAEIDRLIATDPHHQDLLARQRAHRRALSRSI
ncbi:MAG: hypothetical protein U0414_25380 [Polyangiaceae bacterium]